MGGASATFAGFTSPKFAILGVTSLVADGARSVTILAGDLAVRMGDFDFPNTVQGGTTLHVVLWQGTSFVRYPLHAAPMSGTSTTLADDAVADVEVATLLGEGGPAPSGTQIISLSATSLTVTLPASFTAGSCHAQLVTLFNEAGGANGIVSNVVPFTLP